MPIHQWLFNRYNNFSLLHIYTNNKKKLLVRTYKFTGDLLRHYLRPIIQIESLKGLVKLLWGARTCEL